MPISNGENKHVANRNFTIFRSRDLDAERLLLFWCLQVTATVVRSTCQLRPTGDVSAAPNPIACYVCNTVGTQYLDTSEPDPLSSLHRATLLVN